MSNLNFPSEVGESPTTVTDPYPAADADSGTDAAAGASSLAAEADEATDHVIGVAKQETRSVASEAGRQARKLAGQVREELRDQAATQQSRVADGLHSAGSAFSTMAANSDDGGYAPQLVRAVGERVDSAASWLGTRDPGALLDDVKRFARRRPGVFLTIAVGAGVLVGRVTRALATPSTEGDGNASTAASRNGFDAPPAPPLRHTAPRSASKVGGSGNGSVSTDGYPSQTASDLS